MTTWQDAEKNIARLTKENRALLEELKHRQEQQAKYALVGQKVYFVLYEDEGNTGWYVTEPNVISEAGTRGFWVSALVDEPDRMDDFIPWSDLETEAFLSRAVAEQEARKRQMKWPNGYGGHA